MRWAGRLLLRVLGIVLAAVLACGFVACSVTHQDTAGGVGSPPDAASDGVAPTDGAADQDAVSPPLDAAADEQTDAANPMDANDSEAALPSDGGDAGSAPTVTGLLITPANAAVAPGHTQQLTATADYSDGSMQDVTALATWSSSDNSTASVDASGLATAYVTGTVTITATYGGVMASTTFTVTTDELVSIQIAPGGSPTLDVGCAPLQAVAIGTYTSGSTQNVTNLVTWTSSNSSVATVDAAGLVTAVAPGSAILSATLFNIVGTQAFTVTAPSTTSVFVAPNVIALDGGATLQLSVTATFSDGRSCDVTGSTTWQSSATNVVTVSSSGLATGVAAGNATITGTQGGASATATVSVRDVASIAVSPPSASTDVGVCPVQFDASATYTDGSTRDITTIATWSSSNPSIATVGAGSGLADGVAPGTVTMSATLRGVSGTAQLTVGSATASSLAVTPASATLGLAEPVQLAASVHMSDGLTCDVTGASTWQSSASSVATVSTGGLVTAVAMGSATVTASYKSLSTGSTITVTSATLSGLAIQPSVANACIGGPPIQLRALATYSDGSTADVTTVSTWSSSNTAIATVGASNGIVQGVEIGTATITATFESQTATAIVQTNCGVITSLKVTPATPSIAVGATQQFTATVTRSDGSTQDVTSSATWSSSMNGVATVSAATGLATGVAAGSTSITAVFAGVSGSATLTVQ